MSEEPGQPQRYCGNCGAEVRSGTAFCVSCGAPIASGYGQPGPESPRSSGGSGSLVEDLKTRLQRITSGLGDSLSRLNTAGVRQVPGRAVEWFRDLPGIPKLVIVGLVGLILLVVLSPVAMIVAGLVLGVSIIALVIQVIHKGRLKNWGIAAVASLVLLFTFGGISEAIYGIGFIGGGGSSGISEADGSGQSGSGEVGSDNSSNEPASAWNGCITGSSYEETNAALSLDYEVIDSETSRAESGEQVFFLVVAVGFSEDQLDVAEEIAQETSEYDAVGVTFLPRGMVYYDPDTGQIRQLSSAIDSYYEMRIVNAGSSNSFFGSDYDYTGECGSSGYAWYTRYF